MDVSIACQRFLEAFRLCSEHAASIGEDMREAITARLIEEYGSPQAAADAVWAPARENEWYREGELAERSLLRRPFVAPARNQAALDLIVAWHGNPIGHLRHDGLSASLSATEPGKQFPEVGH
jgi:serine/threonine-protein kinase HipA